MQFGFHKAALVKRLKCVLEASDLMESDKTASIRSRNCRSYDEAGERQVSKTLHLPMLYAEETKVLL